ncbi:MAG TPA: hypothetical protein VGI39_33320 [Polyangiaceae bacterium]|jgi:hypothetical protein
MNWLSFAPFGVAMLSLVGCSHSDSNAGSNAGAADAGVPVVDGAAIAGTGFFTRITGLWSGPATQTPLGTFGSMNMDIQAEASWLFGRVDLDVQDNLRFAFGVESISGAPTVVFRNGGYFQGVLRDTTTVLVDSDEAAGSYHFCAPSPTCMYVDGGCVPETGGCGFIDALFRFSAPDQLTLNVQVNGQPHLLWTPSRKETRPLASPFPPSSAPQPGDAGWPDLPSVSATVSWTTALAKPTPVWILLSDTPCGTSTCTPSRTLFTTATAGATQATLQVDQVHPGMYDANVLLDLAGSFGTILAPATGDYVNAPPDHQLLVPTSGTAALDLAASYPVP